MKERWGAKAGFYLIAAIILVIAGSASLNAKEKEKMEGTAEQRAACTPDVFRFCTEFIPNHDMIANCLRHNLYRLNKQCRKVFE